MTFSGAVPRDLHLRNQKVTNGRSWILSPEKWILLLQMTIHFLLNKYLEPQTTIYKWLFQLDDSESLHRKWLFHQTSIYKWLFGVPGSSLLGDEFVC